MKIFGLNAVSIALEVVATLTHKMQAQHSCGECGLKRERK